MSNELTDNKDEGKDERKDEGKDEGTDRKGKGGPKTPQGKAISSRNALKHGFTSATFCLPAFQQEPYDKLCADFRAQIQPEGPLEEEIFQHATQSAFNRRRAEAALDIFDSSQSDPMVSGMAARHFDRMERYKLRYERALYRAIRELKNLQTQRARRADLPAEVVEKLPPLAQLQKYSKRTPARRTNGEDDPFWAYLDHRSGIETQPPEPSDEPKAPSGGPNRRRARRGWRDQSPS